jgi:hypothetical protein
LPDIRFRGLSLGHVARLRLSSGVVQIIFQEKIADDLIRRARVLPHLPFGFYCELE